jgi:REP element-mobilizing transposase RayT
MRFDPTVHHRRSIRLKGYDYSQAGAYFVTLVTNKRDQIFGKIVNGEMQLSKEGQIVAYHWNLIPAHFPAAKLDKWVIMPNHLHGIIILRTGEASANRLNEDPESWAADASPQRPIGTVTGSLGAILQNFKSVSTRKINQAEASPGVRLWQRNYYEHIIRNETEWQRIRDYIQVNPLHWQEDQLHLSAGPNPFNQE